MDEGKKHIYDVYTLHLVRWKEDLFSNVHESVMASVLRMVERQRNGETIEQAQIKSIVDSFGMPTSASLLRKILTFQSPWGWMKPTRPSRPLTSIGSISRSPS